jgi:hypothetical protein
MIAGSPPLEDDEALGFTLDDIPEDLRTSWDNAPLFTGEYREDCGALLVDALKHTPGRTVGEVRAYAYGRLSEKELAGGHWQDMIDSLIREMRNNASPQGS